LRNNALQGIYKKALEVQNNFVLLEKDTVFKMKKYLSYWETISSHFISSLKRKIVAHRSKVNCKYRIFYQIFLM